MCPWTMDNYGFEDANSLTMQVRSLLDSKYKLESRILELNTKLTSTEKGLEEKSQVDFLHICKFLVIK